MQAPASRNATETELHSATKSGFRPDFTNNVNHHLTSPAAEHPMKPRAKVEVEAADGTRVSRTLINFWLDAGLMVTFVALSLVAVIVQFVFPPGVAAKGWLLWGLNYGQWCSLQFTLLSLLGFGIVVHVMLHWTWVCSVINRKLLHHRDLPDDGIRTVYGVGLLIVLLLMSATVVGVAMMTIRMPPQ